MTTPPPRRQFVASPETTPLPALGTAWLDWLTAAGRSADTIRIRRRVLRALAAHAAAEGWPADPAAWSAGRVGGWLGALRQSGLAHNSVCQYHSCARSWYAWLVREGHAPASPFARIPAPRPVEPPVEPPTPALVQELIDACRDRGRVPAWLPLRDAAIIAVLLDTGLRAGELLQLRAGDGAAGAGTVVGKGGRPRLVRLSVNVAAAVRAYLDALPEAPAPDAPLWRRRGGGALRYGGLQYLMREAGRRCGVRLHAHLLRHAFGTWLLDGSDDFRATQALLGHARPAMTDRYTRTVAVVRAQRTHATYSPARGLRL